MSSLLVSYPIRQVLWDFFNAFAIGFQVLYWIYNAEFGSRSPYFCVFCNTFVPLFDSSVRFTNFVPVPRYGYYASVEIPGEVQWVLYIISYPKSSMSSLLDSYPIRQVLYGFFNPFAIGFQVLYWICYAEFGSRSRYFCVFCNTFVLLFDSSVWSTNFVPVPWY